MIYWIKKYFTDPAGHWRALYEVVVIAIFSLGPFVITFFTRAALSEDGTSVDLYDIVGRGQLYLLSYGIFGTVFWLAFPNPDKPMHGARALLGTVATLIALPVIGFIGVDPTFSSVLNSKIINLGYWVYGLFLLIYYLILFYTDIVPPEPNTVLEREANDMRKKYEELTNG